jgi:hypothetical protein
LPTSDFDSRLPMASYPKYFVGTGTVLWVTVAEVTRLRGS